MRRSFALIWMLLASVSLFAQGGRYDSTVNSSTYVNAVKVLTAMSGAKVQLCTAPANATPCTNYATTYTDSTLTTACNGSNGCSNPITADNNGNFGFWVASGQYQYTYTYQGQNFGPYSVTIASNDPKTLNPKTLNGIRYADQYSGSDMGAQVNAAYADLPSTGGAIEVPSKSDGTCWVVTTPIALNTNGKPALLKGYGKSTCFDYSSITSGKYVTLDWGQGSPQGYQGGMEDIRILGACATTACSGVTAVAVDVGPTNGAVGALLKNVLVGGFASGKGAAVGFQFDVNSYIVTCINCQSMSSAIGVKFLGAENYQWIGGSISQNAIGVSVSATNTDAYFHGVSFDDNTTEAILQANGNIIVDGCHFENAGLGTSLYYVGTGGLVNFQDGVMLEDRGSGTYTSFLKGTVGGTITMRGTGVFSGGATVSAIASINNYSAFLFGINNTTPSLIPKQVDVNFGTRVLDWPLRNDVAQPDIVLNFWNFVIQGGGLKFGEMGSNPTGFLASGQENCRGDSASHSILCSYNADGPYRLPRVIASGTATMTTAAITAGNCGTTVTVAATGVLATDSISWAFNAAPAGTNAGLVTWPTAGNVNFAYCPNAAETPVAATINWQVVR